MQIYATEKASQVEPTVEDLNKADLYSASKLQYFIETMHGIYPIGAYGYLAGFDLLDDALTRLNELNHSSPGQLRLVNKRREVLCPTDGSLAVG